MTARAATRAATAGRCRLIYFSSVPYASYAQRPHFMVQAFADQGFDAVLWIDPYPTRLPSLGDLRRVRKAAADVVHPVDPRVEVVRPRALPIEPLPLSGALNRLTAWRALGRRMEAFARGAGCCVLGIGRPSKLADWALRHVPHDRSFADVLDNFPAFYRGWSRRSMQRRMSAMLASVDDVYCSSSALADEVRRERADALTVLNGYSTAGLPEPSAAAQRNCIGYVGSIADWFDWPLVQALAEALPDVSIRLVGPEFVARPANLSANVELLGEVAQKDVAALVREFTVGLIPFRVNALTDGVDPIKFYEYRSLGVPVWSTAFGEMVHRGHADGVTQVTSGSDWRALWNDARTAVISAEEVASFRREVDWSRRFDPMIERSHPALVKSKAEAGVDRLQMSQPPSRPQPPVIRER
ncbi:glycosyltransferase [Burkholderia plantarii]|uniref:glycosyltransferase n=1 Tax=Burkholderia plantarii TaxID=41899 RepID=UPI0007064E88|nr:glycosyltransferase [Burkholderia plantarii]ALK33778.1 putative glycosyltransferase [Burkholderia plantarii]GLZ16955.1 glycosyl transferase [Burkholderia plantarii]